MQPLTGEDLHNSVEGNLVIIEPVNEVHSRVIADNGIKQELVDFFTFINNCVIFINKLLKKMTPEAERFNGWAAMLGFVAAVGAYVTTGQIIPGWF